MNMADVRSYARSRGVVPGSMRKGELIRTIQRREGNFDCFGTATAGICDQIHCLWRSDCFLAARKKDAGSSDI